MTDKLMNKLRIIGREAAEKQLFIIWEEVREGKTDYRDTQAHALAENVVAEVMEDYGYRSIRTRNIVLKTRMEQAARRAIRAELKRKE